MSDDDMSDALIFLSISSFHNLLYETPILLPFSFIHSALVTANQHNTVLQKKQDVLACFCDYMFRPLRSRIVQKSWQFSTKEARRLSPPRAICIGFFFYIVFLCIVALLPIVCVLESKIAVEPFYFFHAFTLEPFERYIVDVAVCRYYITWLNRCAV